MKKVLNIVNSIMTNLGLNYEFGEMTTNPPNYPYWVGDYLSTEATEEDGEEEFTFTLNGFHRGNFIGLENEKQALKNALKEPQVFMTDVCAIQVCWGGCLNIQTDDIELKRCQVTLNIKRW